MSDLKAREIRGRLPISAVRTRLSSSNLRRTNLKDIRGDDPYTISKEMALDTLSQVLQAIEERLQPSNDLVEV